MVEGGRTVSVETLIDGVIGREGRYSNNPADSGGATMWGITERVARACGYTGPMRALPRDTAKEIYFTQYVRKPGFAALMGPSERIAEELVDTGVNMGPAVASLFLQRCLNALNRQGRDYNDIIVDGDVGPATLNALNAFLRTRGAEGETALLRALNCLQGERYIELAEKRSANETFLYGWLRTRAA
jgi:lysozyme family protein